jgi:hypothetical protein
MELRKYFGSSLKWGTVLVALLHTSPALAAAETEKLPELATSMAQKYLAGVAQSGQEALVVKRERFETGERFAQIRLGDAKEAYWVQLAEGEDPRVGERFSLNRTVYLFTSPVAEVEEEDPSAALPEPKPLGPPVYDEETLKSLYPMNHGKLGMASNCKHFITPTGHFGAWGEFMMGKLSPSEHPEFFSSTGDMARVCPKFKTMTVTEKKNFWVWLVASMANNESSCKPTVTARGVNGTAAGLLQLHKGKEYVYGCKRGINSLRALPNLECGMTILNRDLKRTNLVFPRNKNYWEVLRPHTHGGKKTVRMAKAYKPCF